jgi:hypothetical protein
MNVIKKPVWISIPVLIIINPHPTLPQRGRGEAL